MEDGVKVAMNTDALGEQIVEMSAHIDAAMHRLLTTIREFDLASGWQVQGALSCAHWLAWRVGWDLRTARERVRVAHKLAELPLVKVIITVPHASLHGSAEPSELAMMADGEALATTTARRLCCDAGVVIATVDACGMPQSIGRKTRTIFAAIKRALRLRDRTPMAGTFSTVAIGSLKRNLPTQLRKTAAKNRASLRYTMRTQRTPSRLTPTHLHGPANRSTTRCIDGVV